MLHYLEYSLTITVDTQVGLSYVTLTLLTLFPPILLTGPSKADRCPHKSHKESVAISKVSLVLYTSFSIFHCNNLVKSLAREFFTFLFPKHQFYLFPSSFSFFIRKRPLAVARKWIWRKGRRKSHILISSLQIMILWTFLNLVFFFSVVLQKFTQHLCLDDSNTLSIQPIYTRNFFFSLSLSPHCTSSFKVVVQPNDRVCVEIVAALHDFRVAIFQGSVLFEKLVDVSGDILSGIVCEKSLVFYEMRLISDSILSFLSSPYHILVLSQAYNAKKSSVWTNYLPAALKSQDIQFLDMRVVVLSLCPLSYFLLLYLSHFSPPYHTQTLIVSFPGAKRQGQSTGSNSNHFIFRSPPIKLPFPLLDGHPKATQT